jgi:copper chaperone CopZ
LIFVKKRYTIEDLCCANCAAKMEEGIRKIEGVHSAHVNFLTQKLTLDAEDDRLDAILDEAERIIKKIEPDCVLQR